MEIISARQKRIKKQQRDQQIADTLFLVGMTVAIIIIGWIVIGDYIEARQMLEAAKAGTL